MIGFEQYAQIKNNYCLCYFGYSDEYLVQLRLIKPTLEQRFPGLTICLGCKDDKIHLLKDSGPLLAISKIKSNRKNYAYIREIRFNGKTHPIENLLTETPFLVEKTAKNGVFTAKTADFRLNNRCVIITHGAHPTQPLKPSQTKDLERLAKSQGFEPEVNTDVSNASLVMGVESVGLFEAAAQGIPTKLVPTGLGTRLYRCMFPKGEIFKETVSNTLL
jgi:hypothetical protein